MAPAPLLIHIGETPDRVLWPNTGAHRRTKAPYIASARATAADATLIALATGTREWVWDGDITLDVTVCWPKSQRRLDFDNMIASLKAYQDGIFDNLAANDRQIRWYGLSQIIGGTPWGNLTYRIIAGPPPGGG